MKKIVTLSLFLIVLTSACTNERLPEPKPHSELIVGEWYSTKVKHLFGVGEQEQTLDSVQTNVKLTFTDDFYVYTELLDSVGAVHGFSYDTARYNFSRDTIFFIKNALAEDTFMIKSLDEVELSLIIDDYRENIAGHFLRKQIIIDFSR